MRVRALGIAFLVFSLAIPAFAADRVIQNGTDLSVTPADGSSFLDFAKKPIPAGFFCPGSSPFTGKVAFKGEPIVTGPPGAFGATDTIVQRLDDAVFNKQGVARTRIQFRVLSLKSLAPIENECGKFNVTVGLDGVQPVTRMVITRENKTGGRFTVPLALNVKVRFEPVGRVSKEALEIPVTVRFPGNVKLPWQKAAAPVPAGFVLVDTDGDRVADTYLPGPSNFIAGKGQAAARGAGSIEKGYYSCHTDESGDQHCFWTCTSREISEGSCGIEP